MFIEYDYWKNDDFDNELKNSLNEQFMSKLELMKETLDLYNKILGENNKSLETIITFLMDKPSNSKKNYVDLYQLQKWYEFYTDKAERNNFFRKSKKNNSLKIFSKMVNTSLFSNIINSNKIKNYNKMINDYNKKYEFFIEQTREKIKKLVTDSKIYFSIESINETFLDIQEDAKKLINELNCYKIEDINYEVFINDINKYMMEIHPPAYFKLQTYICDELNGIKYLGNFKGIKIEEIKCVEKINQVKEIINIRNDFINEVFNLLEQPQEDKRKAFFDITKSSNYKNENIGEVEKILIEEILSKKMSELNYLIKLYALNDNGNIFSEKINELKTIFVISPEISKKII